jgi:hypothetical protein
MRRCSVAALLLLAASVLLGMPPFARGQSSPDAPPLQGGLPPPVYAAHVEGQVTVTRDGASVALDLNAPLLDGDRVRTTPTSRVELATPEWGHAFLDHRTTLDVRRADRLRLLDGRARLDLTDSAQHTLGVETPAAGIQPAEAGSYLIEVVPGDDGDEVTLTVVEGAAEFQTDRGALTVRTGESARVRGMRPPELGHAPEPAAEEPFASYVAQRLSNYHVPAEARPEALPEELASYASTLSRHGHWEDDPADGVVWYPSVSPDWQPYGDGRWDRVGHYGWFWVGASAWSWPTHHYGRWGVRGSRWFWVPDRTWAPSWVAWAVGPGYVGWCALAQDGRPVVPFGARGPSASSVRGSTSVGEDRWRGWHLVGRDGFEARAPFRYVSVNPRTLPHGVTSSFVTQRVPPVFVRQGGVAAVPRPALPMSRELANQTVLRRGQAPTRESSPPPAEPLWYVPEPATGDSPYDRARPYMARPTTRRAPPTAPGERGAPQDPQALLPGTGSSEPTAAPRGVTSPRPPRTHAAPPGQGRPSASSPEPSPAPPPAAGLSAGVRSTPSHGDTAGHARAAGPRSDAAGRSRVRSRPPR